MDEVGGMLEHIDAALVVRPKPVETKPEVRKACNLLGQTERVAHEWSRRVDAVDWSKSRSQLRSKAKRCNSYAQGMLGTAQKT